MNVNELARKAAEEWFDDFSLEHAAVQKAISDLAAVIAKHFAPLAERLELLEIQAQYTIGRPTVAFQSEWAVFGNNLESSLCYTTSEERAQYLADMLNDRAHITEQRDRLLRLVKHRNVHAEHIGKPQDQPGWDTHDLCPCWDCRCNRLISECEKEDKP